MTNLCAGVDLSYLLRRIPFALSALSVFSLLLCAAPPKIDPDMKIALDRALALRVELATDLLLALVDSGRVPRSIAIDYLDRLFSRAAEAQRGYPTIAVPRRDRESKSGAFPQLLSQLGTTRHDIRLRVVLRMAALDPERARRLLPEILNDVPSIDADCRQSTIPVYAPAFYTKLPSLLPHEFGAIVLRIATPQQAAALIEALPVLKATNSADIVSAMHSLARVLETTTVSDRVFTSTELRLKLGANLQKLSSAGVVPSGMDGALVKSWIQFVDRHLRRERCSDVTTAANEDMVTKVVVDIANHLAESHNLSRLDLSRLEMRYSRDLPERSGSDGPDAEVSSLLTLGSKLSNGGSPEVAARFASELQAYAGKALRPGGTSFDIAARAGMLLMIMDKFEDDFVAQMAIKEIFRILEHPRLKEQDATAWIVVARTTLNLAKHPRASIARLVANQLSISSDIDIATYYSVTHLLRIPAEYNKNAFSAPVTIMTSY